VAPFEQQFRQLPTADHAAGQGVFDCCGFQAYALPAKLVDHFVKALNAAPSRQLQGGSQVAVVRTAKISEQMKLAATAHTGDFDARNDLELPTGRGLRFFEAGKCVMVGNRQGRQACTASEFHDLDRCVRAIAARGVNV
jgi:hypothetical protein